ncbi:hypothetical protein [Sulfurovum sp. NBC37-1]|uniref:hypothetical protein n=1 Tax=Sulfurovum sp. (strain NBC37-1) TaxID=387093 RepID=UPI0001587B7F|nr:hypothetical protein [Sulfurovum sp. NBC37-1]BAF72811.1 conserved hypothetical protein [Sulfurovum sp. NBC37-1]
MKKLTWITSMAAVLATGATAASLEERVAALEEKNNTLTEEVLATQTGGFTLVDTENQYNGLGPAASKVYFSKNPLSIGGYGEMYYANPKGGDDYADVYRFVTYFGYKFSENVILNAEIEFEHGANAEDGGEVAIEFMYLDFLWRDEANFRLGNLLVPMGLINLRHEPILFNTVQRPEVENKLIPSTWHENGALIYGRLGDTGLEYTAGIINALNLNNVDTMDAKPNWIRDGRQGSKAKAAFDPAFVGRVDYTGINGLLVGASLYYGAGSNLKDPKLADPIQDVSGLTTTMFDIHANYENGPFRAYGLYTQTILDGAEKISNTAVEKAKGYYVNFSYDVGSLAGVDYKIPLFVQYEDLNPIASTVDGLNEDTYKTKTTTIGMNFFPVDQVVLKADYAMKEVNNQDQDVFSAGLGFVF